jgi:cadmium resistance protein CadD (predicted permease)
MDPQIDIFTVIAIALGGVADFAPAQYLGYLGLIPIALGIQQLVNLIRQGTERPNGDRAESKESALTVSFVMLANSGDSFIVYLSIFADTQSGYEPKLCASVSADRYRCVRPA